MKRQHCLQEDCAHYSNLSLISGASCALTLVQRGRINIIANSHVGVHLSGPWEVLHQTSENIIWKKAAVTS